MPTKNEGHFSNALTTIQIDKNLLKASLKNIIETAWKSVGHWALSGKVGAVLDSMRKDVLNFKPLPTHLSRLQWYSDLKTFFLKHTKKLD